FADVLLRHGARQVVAVDVGYGQLAWRLRQDERVVVHDRTNIRELDLATVGDPVDLVVGDLSFISLTLVLDALISVTDRDGDLVLMVKPQFEVGRSRVGKGGVAREPELRAEAVEKVGSAGGVPERSRSAPCPGRPATWSSFSGSHAGRPRSGGNRSAWWCRSDRPGCRVRR